MEWIFDPTIWIGLTTLVVIEIVLGIDNLIFIAILADKLAPEQRRKARFIGLVLALAVRLVLLTCISWMTTLKDPLFFVMGQGFSWHSLIMIFGGGFLLFKATVELHEKLEGSQKAPAGSVNYASFWQVIVQIVVLDAVFSLDAVITAVGMVEHLPVMMIAVCIAIALMILASGPLMNFVSGHPTVIILCLGFLLMIGFSLVVEGIGYHIPKGYLYAAIGFSVTIEAFNQLALRSRSRGSSQMDLRVRTSQAVLSLLGGVSSPQAGPEITALAEKSATESLFGEQERLMIQRILNLAEQDIPSIMTPRHDLHWIDLSDPVEDIRREIQECPFSWLVVARDKAIAEPIGILHKKDLADALISNPSLDRTALKAVVRQPLILPDSVTILHALDSFRQSRLHAAFVVDEYGALEGLVTLTDVAEAIAGDLPGSEENDAFAYTRGEDGSVTVSGTMSVHELKTVLDAQSLPEGSYNTAAGLALDILRRLPIPGDWFDIPGWHVTIEEIDKRRIRRLKFKPVSTTPET